DAEAGGRRAVRPKHAPAFPRPDLDPRNLAEPYEVPVVALEEHEPAEVLRGLIIAGDSHLKVEVSGLDPPGRQLEVLAAQRVLDIADGQAACGERVPIEPYAHRRSAGAEGPDLRDARNG